MKFLAAFFAATLCAASAIAAPITIIQTGSGTGSLGDTPFSNALFTITAHGNTDAREFDGFDVYSITHTSATIEIEGLGTYSFLSGTRTFVTQSLALAGLSRPPIDGFDLYYAPTDSAFATWDMLTSIATISGGSELLQWGVEEVVTSGGVLDFLNGSPEGTFQAIVPEPSSIVLSAFAFIGLAAFARRRLN